MSNRNLVSEEQAKEVDEHGQTKLADIYSHGQSKGSGDPR